MFKVFDRNRKQLDILENPISPVITNVLGGIGELKFSVPSTYDKLELEGYIQVENDHEYVIKEIVTHGTNRDVVCILNIEEILGKAWHKIRVEDKDLVTTARLLLSGTSWTVVNKSSSKVTRNLLGSMTNSYNLLQLVCTLFDVEFIFDTFDKTVTFVDKVGKDAGVYFMSEVNLRQLNIDTHTHKYITRVIPIGKDGLTIESVNGGKNYLENTSYTNKVICGIWQSDKHTKPEDLKADAQRFLNDMAIPYETYEVMIQDLYRLSDYQEFEYGLGDIVTLVDGDTQTRIKQRVIQRSYNLLEPDRDTINIANKDMRFEDYYKRLQTIADMTEGVINGDGSINGGSLDDGSVSGDKLEEDSITSDHIQAGVIVSDHISAGSINAGHINSNSITADHIQAGSIIAEHIVSETISAEHIKSNAIQAKHLQAGTITSEHIQAGSITAGSGIIADGAIGSAQIAELDTSKLTSGTIDTSKITISGANSNLKISGNRLQVFDGIGSNQVERVSLGDVEGDGTTYGLRVRGKDGKTVLIDENGVTNEGITDGSITNEKISDNADIDAGKINIDSVVTKINEGTTQISGNRIDIDNESLSVVVSRIEDTQTTQGNQLVTAQSSIQANADAIKSKVSQSTYEKDKEENTTKYEFLQSEIAQTKGEVSSKVEQVTYDREVGTLKTDVANVKQTATGLSSTVSSLSTDVNGVKQDMSRVEQTATGLSSTVSDLNGKYTQLKQTVDGFDLTGKVSFSDLSTSGRTVINGANITTGYISGDRIKGGIISATDEINFVGGARIFGNSGSFGAGLKISAQEYQFKSGESNFESDMYAQKNLTVSGNITNTTGTLYGRRVELTNDAVIKGTTYFGTGTYYATSAGGLKMNNISTSSFSTTSSSIGTVTTNRLDVYGYSNLDGNMYTSGSATIAGSLTVGNQPIYGMNNIALARGTVYLPQGGGNNTTDYLRIGYGFMACVDSGNFHFLTRSGSATRIYASNVTSAYSLDNVMQVDSKKSRSVFDEINSVNVIDTAEGFKIASNPVTLVDGEDKSSRAISMTYNEKTKQEEVNLDYTTAISTLWKAVQELKEENNELRKLINGK